MACSVQSSCTSDPCKDQSSSAQSTEAAEANNGQSEHHAQLSWWQLSPSSTQILTSAKFASSPKKAVPLTDENLRLLTPCEVVRGALPASLASQLLKILLADSASWTRGTWYMGGKEHLAPRTSAYYSLQDRQEMESEAMDVSSAVQTQAAPAELQSAAAVVCDHVNRLAGRVGSSLADDDRHGWQCSYALCNMYQDSQEGVGPHADRLTQLGPRPIIASLSLGATRTFRMKNMAPAKDVPTQTKAGTSVQQQLLANKHAAADKLTQSGVGNSITSDRHAVPAGAPTGHHEIALGAAGELQRQCGEQHEQSRHVQELSQSAQQERQAGESGQQQWPPQPSSGSQGVVSADVELPHNTLVIMWPPMQEAWKHEIPKCKQVERHPIAGKARINLTFRQLKPAWVKRAPSCRCSQQAVLKASLPSSAVKQQLYYYTCDNTKGPGCGFYQQANISL